MDRLRKVTNVMSIAVAMFVGALSLGAAGAIGQPAPFCPPSAPRAVKPDPWRAAMRELAPKGGRPIELCRYAGVGASGSREFVSSRLLYSQKTIHVLIREFDSLRAFPPSAKTCGLRDDESEVLAELLYRHRYVRILVGLSGRNPVTNGDLTRTAVDYYGRNPAGPRLLKQLKRLTQSGTPHLARQNHDLYLT